MDLSARADLLAPFLRRAIDADEEGWERVLNECVGTETYRCVAIEVALTDLRCPNDIVDRAIGEASGVCEMVRTTIMLRQVDDRIISQLLDAEDPRVVCATLEGIWHKLKKSPTNAPWYDKWRDATVRHLDDDYCLRGAITDDPRLCQDWIAYLASASFDQRHLERSDVALAIDSLTDEQRNRLIYGVKPNARHAASLVLALVGDSPDRYDTLLKNQELKKFWAVPLQRKLDAVWKTFVGMALQNGVSDQTIVDQTRIVLSGFGEIPGKCHVEIEAWTSCREAVVGPVARIVEAGLKEARRELECWGRSERDV